MALGGRIEIDVVPNLNNFDRQLRSGLQRSSSGIATAGKAIGVALAAGTAIAAVGFKQAIDLGIEFQNNLNNLQAVTHATDQQMAAVSRTATALGNDLSLPATSAAGAAEAMLELAKGGLTVEQSMTAAKGTLQLAAAAQVDGAKAAEIQANALNAFGLSADNAGHVADVLANASNAASGEITDFAQALQSVGAVSHQFGVSLDDTITALGLFANAGIKGSDAGTLLKTALLSLANPSKPAAAAMKTLGLNAFDATGKFVGLESIFGQLRAASQRLTPEMYAQATATVFGTDAVRLAGIAANTTGEQWDQIAAAVGRAGGAQEVAAAKMKGLGGALQGLNSQIETAELQVFDAIKGPLEQAVRFATDLVPKIGEGIASGVRVAVAIGRTVGPQLAAGIAAGAGEVAGAAQDLVGPFVDSLTTGIGIALQTGSSLVGDYVDVLRNVLAFLTPVADGFGQVADAAVRGDGALTAAAATFSVLGSAVSVASGILIPVGAIVGGLVSAFGALPGPIQSVAFAMIALKFGSSILSGLGSAFTTVTQNTGIFGRAVAGLTSPVRAFGSGINQAVQNSRNFAGANAEAASAANNAVGSYGRLNQGVAAVGRGLAGGVSAVRQFGGEMRTQGALANGFGYNLSTLEKAQAAFRVSTIGAVAATRTFGDQVSQIRAGAAGAGQPISTMGAAMRALGENVPLLARMGAAFTTASSNATRFGAAAGVAAAAATGIRGAIGGLVGALGGPWGLAITGAVIGLGLLASANQAAQAAEAAHKASVDALAESLKATGGQFTQSAVEALVSSDEFKKAADSTKQFGISLTDLRDAVIQGGPPLEARRAQLQAIVDANTITTYSEYGTATALTATGQAAQTALNDLNSLAAVVGDARGSYDQFTKATADSGASLINGAKAGSTLKEAIGVLANAAADADSKVRALNDALDALSGGQVSAEKANARLNESVEKIGPAFTDAANGAKAAKTGLLDASGAINTTTESGRSLLTATTDLRSTMLDSAQAAFDAAGGYGNLAPATKAASDAAQRTHDSFIAAATAAGLNATQAEALAARYGLIPTDVVTLIRAQGLDQVGQEILGIKTKFDQVPNEKSITVQTLSADAEQKLKDLGITVTHLPNGQVLITAPTDAAKANLDAFLAFASGQVAVMSLDANPDPATGKINGTVQLGNGQIATMTLDANPSPADGKIHGTVALGNGQTATITLDANADPATGQINGTVSYGNGQTSTIKVKADASAANTAINNAARDRTMTIHVAYQTAHRALGAITTPAYAQGGLTSPAYMATGGLRQPRRMSGFRAEIVPPRQPRIIGDRQIDDEAFIPINRSSRSRAIFEETARRMGYAVARMYADGGVATTRSADTTALAALRATGGSPDVVAAINGLATRIGAIERQVVIQTTVNNPLPERGSDSIARVNRRQHALGLFG